MLQRYLIIADDFTGANDSGLQLRRKGLSTLVQIGHQVGPAKKSDALVLDTESRNTDEESAAKLVRSTLQGMDAQEFSVVVKKIDSTLRGNICSEVLEVASFFHADVIVVSPAFPEQGRTVKDGRLLVRGVPLVQTEHGKDPRKPVLEDNLVKLFTDGQKQYAVKHLFGSVAFPQETQKQLFVCDAETHEDLLRIAAWALSLQDKRVLFVGSAGIVDAIVSSKISSRGVVALVASLSNVTRRQVRYAMEQNMETVVVPVESLLESDDFTRFGEQVSAAIQDQKPVLVVVSSVVDEQAYDQSRVIGKRLGLTPDAVAANIRDGFSRLGKTLVENKDLQGVLLSGGDTAYGLLEALDVHEVELLREVQVGIPLLRVVSGPYASLKIITKAGAFGNQDAIAYGLRVLQER